MTDSSDEEINFEDEIIDLEALWRDRPFLTDYKREEKIKALPAKPAQPNNAKPIVIELIPISEIIEKAATSRITDLINKFEEINREIANAREAADSLFDRNTNYANRLDTIRQRIRGLGGPIREENNSSRPKWNSPRTSPSRTLPGTSSSFSALANDHPSTSRGSQQSRPNINKNGIPRWVPRRYQRSGTADSPTTSTTNSPNTPAEDKNNNSRFLLPEALKKWY